MIAPDQTAANSSAHQDNGASTNGASTNGALASPLQLRAGGRVLSLFSTPLHGLVLRALADGPMRLSDLRKEAGGPAQTTLRGNLGNLIGIGALERHKREGALNVVDNELTPFGQELLLVADSLEAWLGRAPGGPIELESEAAKAAIKALLGGWGSTMLRALAARPFSLTEIDNLITSFTYPALERRLSAMCIAEQVVAMPRNGNGTPYAATDWLRQGIAPLLLSIRCERRHMVGETTPPTRIDIEAILLLVAPLVSLGAGASGHCQLMVDMGDDSKRGPAGVSMTIEGGKIVSCVTKLETGPSHWARGSAAAWFQAIVDGDATQLHVGGDPDLVLGVVTGLNETLFRPRLAV